MVAVAVILAGAALLAGAATARDVTATVKTIPGLTPVDVYGNLKNKGLRCVGPRRSAATGRTTWTCSDSDAFNTYDAFIASTNTLNVTIVQATVTSSLTRPTAGAPRDYIGYVATIPYRGSRPAAARAWVVRNFSRSHARTTIGRVIFEMWGRGRAVLLEIRPA